MSDEGYHVHPDDLPPIWQEATGSPVQAAFAVLILEVGLVFFAISPALVIGVWRWLV